MVKVIPRYNPSKPVPAATGVDWQWFAERVGIPADELRRAAAGCNELWVVNAEEVAHA